MGPDDPVKERFGNLVFGVNVIMRKRNKKLIFDVNIILRSGYCFNVCFVNALLDGVRL